MCPTSKKTLHTEYVSKAGGYVHYFRSSSCEIPCDDVMYSHKVKVYSSSSTKLVAYTLTSPTTMHTASDVYNKCIAMKVKSPIEFVVNYKRLVLVTSSECVLEVTIVPVTYVDNYIQLEYTLRNTRDGHLTVSLPETWCVPRSIPRMLRSGSITPVTMYYGLKYCLSMNAMLTVTEDVPKDMRYPPYSVKLPQMSGIVSTLRYKISIKASEGNTAQVTVSCIESLSRNRYALLKDKQGGNIHNVHQGQLLEGTFTLTECPVDVGLHIYTPYGFSGDIGDNPDKDLASIEEFTVSCQ